MQRIARWTGVLALAAMAGVALGQVTTAQPDARERFEGTWRYAGPPAEGRAIIQRAIDRATEDMFFLTRGIARDRLEETNLFTRDVELGFPPGRIRVGFDMIGYDTPADGTVRRVPTPDGGTANLSQRFENGRLVQVFSTDEGRRTNVFRLARGGDTLLYDVRVDSEQLPEPVRYRLVYRRVP